MTIYTDSRGYSYIGDQIQGNDFGNTFAFVDHDSVTGGSTTSEIATAMQAQVGNGKWGLFETQGSGTWGTGFTGGFPAIVWTPSSITTPASVDVTTLVTQTNANGFTNTSYNSFVFGSMMRNNSSGTTNNNVITTNNTKVVRPSGSLGAPFINTEEHWVSAGPEHLGIYGLDYSGNHSYLYFCRLQGGNLADPNDRYYAHRDTSSNIIGFRADTAGVNSNQSILTGSSIYSDTLATQPNTTGDPYLTRWYPLDNGGPNANLSAGYAPDLFLYHDDDIGVGDIINMADLTAGGAYNPGNLDGSDFTYAVCLSGQGAGYRLLMRIGERVI